MEQTHTTSNTHLPHTSSTPESVVFTVRCLVLPQRLVTFTREKTTIVAVGRKHILKLTASVSHSRRAGFVLTRARHDTWVSDSGIFWRACEIEKLRQVNTVARTGSDIEGGREGGKEEPGRESSAWQPTVAPHTYSRTHAAVRAEVECAAGGWS